MDLIKNPLSGAGKGAGQKKIDYFKISPLSLAYQAKKPISWLIRSILIESLVSRRYTRKRSLKVDGLLVATEFFEEACHV